MWPVETEYASFNEKVMDVTLLEHLLTYHVKKQKKTLRVA